MAFVDASVLEAQEVAVSVQNDDEANLLIFHAVGSHALGMLVIIVKSL
jgi:hypothetical protein